MKTDTKVQDIIRSSFGRLTRSERQLANALTSHYPMSALGSITTIAEQAGVSTPTVVRMVRKLGFKGFPDFQTHIHEELETTLSNPIAKHDRWANDAPDTHILNRFAEATIANLRETLSGIGTSDFDRARDLLKDLRNHVYIVGGRITKSLAEYLFTHCQVIRPNVTLIAPHSQYLAALCSEHEVERCSDNLRHPALRTRDRNAQPDSRRAWRSYATFHRSVEITGREVGDGRISCENRGPFSMGLFGGDDVRRGNADRGDSKFGMEDHARSHEGP